MNPFDSVIADGVRPSMAQDYSYFRHQCEVDFQSAEGLAILDGWAERWAEKFRGAQKKYGKIVCDLSGGADSRACLVLALNAGIKDSLVLHVKNPKFERIPERVEHDERDFAISSLIAGRLGLPMTHTKIYEYLRIPRITGLGSCFKTADCGITQDYRLERAPQEIRAAAEKWLSDHTDADVMDRKQMAFEIAYYQWHDTYKIERENRKYPVLAPYTDPEIKRLKSKGYRLWQFFMQRYCPEMLDYPIEGRGFIGDIIRKQEKEENI